MKLALLLVLAASVNWAATVAECDGHRKHGRKQPAFDCYLELTSSKDMAVVAEGFWGLKQFKAANEAFRKAQAANPKNAELRVRWGMMFLERFNKKDASDLFGEALELNKDHARAMLGLAIVASESYEEKAVEMAAAALKQDSKLIEAQELLARLALEDGNEKLAIAEADKAIAMSPEALNALAVRATIEWLNDKPGTEWSDRILKINPIYGEAWALAAHFFVINRRYEEGILLYRKAIAMEPELWDAKAELGVNLMRLGRDKDARQLLEDAYQHEYKSAAVVNTLTLMDSYKNFIRFQTPLSDVRLHKKEAELLKPFFETELLRAIATFEEKYKMKLPNAVRLEVYPDHEDFAVRTMGLPGLGALGVTFGTVVAMDSPSGRKPGTFHWASTLWHELNHVFVLTATEHRVPRWFAEGMAMHEETAGNPEWGDRLDPGAIDAMAKKKLLPIATLDRGFVRPSYPNQVTVSYFQAGKICDYIKERWGFEKLLEMMRGFAARKTTVEVVEQILGMKPEAFDKDFLTWLDKRVGQTVAGFEEWRKKLKVVAADFKEKKYDDVIKKSKEIRDLYPDYVEAGNIYEFLADSYAEKGDKAAAANELMAYAKIGGRNPETLKRTGKMLEEQGKREEAAAVYERINYVYPVQDEELHTRLGALWLEMKYPAKSILEFSAAVASKPVDPAAAYFNLARAYRAAGRKEEARDNLLNALESAPGFKPAQKMLLELTDK